MSSVGSNIGALTVKVAALGDDRLAKVMAHLGRLARLRPWPIRHHPQAEPGTRPRRKTFSTHCTTARRNKVIGPVEGNDPKLPAAYTNWGLPVWTSKKSKLHMKRKSYRESIHT